MDLREVGYDDRDWINLAQNRDRWRAYRLNEMKVIMPEMNPGSNTESYPAFAHIGLKNPGKNLNQKPRPGIETWLTVTGDNGGEMSAGSSTESYPAFAGIGLRENPGKKPQPGNLPRPGFEPGPPGFAAIRADRYSTVQHGARTQQRLQQHHHTQHWLRYIVPTPVSDVWVYRPTRPGPKIKLHCFAHFSGHP
ncbi:hypothetical protein ANN_12025 [Periplaneta americana]|uniref:Uncharacterized protein n=1 Tax=Periplaneta americana TaxID=6978 RepID=A0ABQ8T843_PERAM|nr:hypothetical protein ANN_12025 [Periplaneta americana]